MFWFSILKMEIGGEIDFKIEKNWYVVFLTSLFCNLSQ